MMTNTPTHPQVYTQTPIDAGFSAIEITRAVKATSWHMGCPEHKDTIGCNTPLLLPLLQALIMYLMQYRVIKLHINTVLWIIRPPNEQLDAYRWTICPIMRQSK